MFASRTSNVVLLTLALLATPLSCIAEKLIPAGTLIQCTVSENKLSSKTVAIGDPVLCQVSRSSVFPSGTVLSGTFEDYKDPGHLVGKGWMELLFDRLILPSNEIIQLDAKVISVPHYSVDLEGKILGKGHDTRDTIEWLIPVLWPIDVLNLPRRGPSPTLKNESRIVVKVMNDLVAPDMAPIQHNQYGFAQSAEPISYSAPAIQQQQQHQPDEDQLVVIFSKYTGCAFATEYWDAGHGRIGFRNAAGTEMIKDLDDIDIDRTIALNRERGIEFHVPGNYRTRNNNLDSDSNYAPMNQGQDQGQSDRGQSRRQLAQQSQRYQNRLPSSSGGGRRR